MPWDKSKYKLGFSESEIGKDSQIKYRPTEDSTDYKTIHVPWIVVEYILEIKKREFDCFYTEERLDKGNNLEKLRYYVAQYFLRKDANPLAICSQHFGANWSFFFPPLFASYGRALVLFLVFTGRIVVKWEWVNSVRHTIVDLLDHFGENFPLSFDKVDSVYSGLVSVGREVPHVKSYPEGLLRCQKRLYDFCWDVHLQIVSNIIKTNSDYLILEF